MSKTSYIERARRASRKEPPGPPECLSDEMKRFWAQVFELKNLQPYQVVIFAKACEAYDRATQAGLILKEKGLTYEDRFKAKEPAGNCDRTGLEGPFRQTLKADQPFQSLLGHGWRLNRVKNHRDLLGSDC